MGLQHSVTIDETTYPEAYSRIIIVRIDKLGSYVYTNTYASLQARLSGEMPIRALEPQLSADALHGNVFELAYAHLKTLPEFAGAIDVFEPADVPADASPAGDAGGAA